MSKVDWLIGWTKMKKKINKINKKHKGWENRSNFKKYGVQAKMKKDSENKVSRYFASFINVQVMLCKKLKYMNNKLHKFIQIQYLSACHLFVLFHYFPLCKFPPAMTCDRCKPPNVNDIQGHCLPTIDL